ncbi:efflux transporter outer membrane subunit [Bythopirellula goksoeyrii]|uniref:Toluene efflux pump outer membrane protein TtgF n=1 Tax=Bythopirellula goksoeyrii TaxID=1400387 RepID=A0A5B9Q3C5_9BACT|nr:efflux transporter outer membrane subunit [Bythopirellula goksoeyrii]QEG33494.1 Toluene efflux pump outer membrane protein TtgF precursor [Bythopirellula goksoeyrii]
MDYAAERQGLSGRDHHSAGMMLGVFVVVFLLATCGCTSLPDWLHNGLKVGPNYVKPMAPVESHWIDYGRDSRISEAPVNTCDWWTVFNDPVLNSLIETAASQNLTLRETGTRILQAQAAHAIAAGNLFPQAQQAFGSYDHLQLSETIANSPPIKNYDLLSTGLGVSWEIDFWGRYRRALESADASLDASIEGYDNVLVILLSDVAATYVKIRTLQEELRLVRENVRLQEEAVTIAEAQFNAGQADAADTLQTRNNVEQTEALIPRFEAALRQANNALCVLLGIPPRDLVAELGEGPIPSAPPEVALGIPAQLLRRRPDIRQAERIVAAQSALIGVAEADLYPFFSIGGTLQWQSQNLSSLFNSNSFGGSTGPSFGWNVLNYGRILNSVRQQEAVFEQAVYAYQGTVLSAQQETEDAIVGFLKAQEQTAKLQLAVRDIEELNQVLLTQANAGATDFSRVFVVQAAATEQMDRLATSRGEIALNLIRIYQALGGGWQIRLQSPSNFPIPVAIEADEPIEVPPIPEPLPNPADLQ